MINIFGDNRATGPRGPKGEDAFDLIKWAPIGVKRLFRESELVNIYFNSATDGVIYSKDQKPVGLKNRGLGTDAKFLGKKFPEIKQIKYHNYMILLKDSLFEIEPARAATANFSTAIFLFTFKSLGRSVNEPRYLFSNKSGSRAASFEERKIKEQYVGVLKIFNSGSTEEIIFAEGDWTGILIQYTCKNGVAYCQYRTNDVSGCLDPKPQGSEIDHKLYIGGHPKKLGANHAMGSFELYYSPITEKEDYILSEKMQKCLLTDVLDRVDEFDKSIV